MADKDINTKRERQRNWLRARRKEYLSDKQCVMCGSKKDLQIDHVDRYKKLSHKIWSWATERRDEEMKKCQILCDNCHKEKSRLEKYFNPYKVNRVGGIKFIGVYPKTLKSENYEVKYDARISIKRKAIHLGSYHTIEEAVNARWSAVVREVKKSPFYYLFKDRIKEHPLKIMMRA